MTDWCILRTKGSSTLRLAHSLNASGFDAWTPVEIRFRRQRRTSAVTETLIAIMPTYVFARAVHLADLAALSLDPLSRHPDFSLFRFDGRFPLIDDSELDILRALERQGMLRKDRKPFENGEAVTAPDGPYEGLTGRVVETPNGKYTLVAFPGFNIPVTFASWRLEKVA